MKLEMKLLLILICLSLSIAFWKFNVKGWDVVDEIAPLEKMVRSHRLDESEVSYIYMYSGARDYQVVMLNNLRHCANQRLKYLAFSTFDEATESAFLTLLSDDLEKCNIVFYGTAEAVASARPYFPNGIFLSGNLDANSSIKLIYNDATKQRKERLN